MTKRFYKNRKSWVVKFKYLLIFLIVGGGLAFYFLLPKAQTKMPVVNKQIVKKAVAAKTHILLSSTPTTSPTPTPLSGYCLRVPVLLYHHIQPLSIARLKKQTALSVDNGIFDQQMAYLISSGYTTISAKQLVYALKTHSILPAKSILVTLDDGYKNDYDYAYPVFQKYHLTANLMIATGLIGGKDYLSWGQLEEMGRSGLIYFVDHTWSHYGVGRGSIDKITYEITTAKSQLEQHTGQTVDIFAYPYGSFSKTAINVLQQNGFSAAFSTIRGFVQCDSILMQLRRTRIGNAPLSSYGL